MSELINIIVAVVALALGFAFGYFLRKQLAQLKANSAEARAEKIINEAKNKEQELLLKTKEKAIKIIDEAKEEEKQRRLDLIQLQKRLEQRESMFDKQLLNFENRKENLQKKVEEIQVIKVRVDEAHKKALEKLETISGYSKEEAKKELFEITEKSVRDDLIGRILKIEKENSEIYENKAKEIVIGAIQRCASDHSSETTSTSVSLPTDDMKGRIIGKDGRNIKTIEKLTGCELIIDETPGVILVSGFSPIRRRVCQIALEKLIKDGRIQPARIEEFIEEAEKE